jgi:hypothetical protein
MKISLAIEWDTIAKLIKKILSLNPLDAKAVC